MLRFPAALLATGTLLSRTARPTWGRRTSEKYVHRSSSDESVREGGPIRWAGVVGFSSGRQSGGSSTPSTAPQGRALPVGWLVVRKRLVLPLLCCSRRAGSPSVPGEHGMQQPFFYTPTAGFSPPEGTARLEMVAMRKNKARLFQNVLLTKCSLETRAEVENKRVGGCCCPATADMAADKGIGHGRGAQTRSAIKYNYCR
ncbi:hypothetical protein B0H11DRAFT_1993529 [Mycena galericulata]|nr:hypothetical protein B0H11DRAFT_1993529 [Mycena galericulata]